MLAGSPKDFEVSVITFWAKAYFYEATSPIISWNLPTAINGFALELKAEVDQMCKFMIAFTDIVNEYRDISYEQAIQRIE